MYCLNLFGISEKNALENSDLPDQSKIGINRSISMERTLSRNLSDVLILKARAETHRSDLSLRYSPPGTKAYATVQTFAKYNKMATRKAKK